MELSKWKPQKVLALDFLIENPTSSQMEIAKHSGVTQGTISNWFKDPGFVETFYDRYMVVYNSRLPSVLDAMVKEAQAGNVQAGRLVLEHSGKLQKNIVIKHESPFERFLKNDVVEGEYEEVEVGDRKRSIPTFTEQPLKVFKSKRDKKLEGRKKTYQLRKRAKLVGLELLPKGRHSKTVRNKWLERLESLEKGQ
jgi:hypothetical protein